MADTRDPEQIAEDLRAVRHEFILLELRGIRRILWWMFAALSLIAGALLAR